MNELLTTSVVASPPRQIERRAADAQRSPPTEQALAEHALDVAYRTALAVTRDAELAADVAQEVAIKATRRAGELRDPAALGAWLHRVAVRTAIDEHRRATTRRAAEDGFGARTPSAHHDADPAVGTLLELLGELPDRQRAAMTLRYVHDLSDRQIAGALGCRTGTARSLLSRATATLRARLAPASTKDLP